VGASDWSARPVPAEQVRRYVADGWWTDEPIGHRLASRLGAHPDLAFVVHSKVRPWVGTFGDVLDLSRRVAGGLARRGVGPGDVVSFQTPNWIEGAATFYGAAMLGAVVAPVVHFYGSHELAYILEACEPKVHVTAAAFGTQDFLANLASIGAATDVVVVGAPGPEGFDALVAGPPLEAPLHADPAAPALVGWTSGTTANPKGVVHSHRTVSAEVRQLGAAQPPHTRPQLVGAPISHAIGMQSALLLPVDLGRAVHLLDVWDPAEVLRLMLADDLAAPGGATVFLTSLLDHPTFDERHLDHMTYQGMGGSPVPRAVTERATRLGITVFRMYGSTEHPSITGCTHADPLEKRLGSDGRPLPGCEVRLVDAEGADVGIGEPGEILSRGPDCFTGYTDAALTAAVFDDDGWYHTGDVGVMDSDGYVCITDRINDVIIRGGENISAAEVEEILMRMPGVAEAAVVAAPDARLGEHAAAFLRMVPGHPLPDLTAVREEMRRVGLARQKWPEEVLEAADLPRTPSGKVQKFVLRDRLRG
jgi:acyl-CoA synthetase